MTKNTKESIAALLTILAVCCSGIAVGYKYGYDHGFNRGVEVNHGDKWDCAYSEATGFLMCDRTPKYK